MTPDEALDLLDGTTHGPWEWREGKDQNGEFVALRGPDGADALRTWDGDLYASGVHGTDADKALVAAAPTLAAMIAGMRALYGVEVQRANGDWLPPYSWHDSPEQARACVTALHVRHTANRRLVRRYVTTPEEA